jgi:hypothetical protein
VLVKIADSLVPAPEILEWAQESAFEVSPQGTVKSTLRNSGFTPAVPLLGLQLAVPFLNKAFG